MLPIQYQNEFDRIMTKVLPFLIFAPLEERNELAKKCTFLFDHLRSESTEPYFEKTSNDIFLLLEKLENLPGYHPSVSDFINLHAEYGERFIGVDKRFEKMEKRLDRLEKLAGNVSKKVSKKVSENISENISGKVSLIISDENLNLTDVEKKIITLLDNGAILNQKEFLEHIEKRYDVIKDSLENLVSAGIIRKVTTGKRFTYELINEEN
jgi:predicted transcriptional regulator